MKKQTTKFKCDNCGKVKKTDSNIKLINSYAGWTTDYCSWDCFMEYAKAYLRAMGYQVRKKK